ncbi:MAG: 16S rRNA (guanine(527)-N(7))-methyltransferase RsmG [Actinomycetota bacterium]|nr:16S rRNA (guanine(527)-N(7))-methyltransferase RsmG [Actinomycetota bacterium]
MRSPEDLLTAYAATVREWAPRLDLVSPRDLARFEERHVQDSLRAVPLLDRLPPGPCIDVGSGAGLPGVPLAVARPGRAWTLLEPRRRRAAFLEEVVRRLDLECAVVALTAEEAAASPEHGGSYVLATARALAEPTAAARMLLPLVRSDGVALLFTGPDVALPPGAEEWQPGLAIMGRPPSTSGGAS